MEKELLKESLQHGTTAFPIAIYPMKFPKTQQVLAHLHYHNEFELLVATKGQLVVQTENETYSLSEGEGLFINSGLLHTILSTGHSQSDSGFIAIVFDYSLLCREYLCRLFHKISGSSPMEYLNRYQIRQSTFLLLQSEERISDIALSCGFSHSSYFGKLFLEYMGCTPTEYRKMHTK